MIDFVGAGPGAVDLITVRGMRIIEKADIIIYAGSLVNKEILSYSKNGARIYNSSSMTLDEVVEVMVKGHAEGLKVVRVHTGDPSIYGAIKEQMDRLDSENIEYRVTPGVSSLFAAAASLKAEYTLPSVSQTLIVTRAEGRTKVPVGEGIKNLASHGATMAIFLSTGLLDKVEKDLVEGGYSPSTKAAIVYKASWDDEKKFICTVSTLSETAKKNNITKTALILVGDFLEGKYELSKLYDPSFTHEFRTASK
ncbi:MAG: precorrin-4 C(11)-methyltransferase [Clostridium sp.]